MKKQWLVVGLIIFLLAVTAGCATEEQDIDNQNRTNLEVQAKLPQEFSELGLKADTFVYQVNKSKKTSNNQQVVFKGVSGDKVEVKILVKDKSGSTLAKGTKQVKLANSSVTEVQVKAELLPGDVKLKVTPNKAGTVKYSISKQSDSFDISSETKSVTLKDVSSGYKNLEISLNSDERDRTVKVMPNDTAAVEVDFTEEEKEDDSVFSSKSIENDMGVAKLEWKLGKEVKGYNVYRSKVRGQKGERINRDLIKDRNFFVDKYLRERDDYFYRIEAVRSDKENITSKAVKLSGMDMDNIRQFPEAPEIREFTVEAGESLTYDKNSLEDGEEIRIIMTSTDKKEFRYKEDSLDCYSIEFETYFNGRFYDEPEQRPTDEEKYPDYSQVHEPKLDGDYKTKQEWDGDSTISKVSAKYHASVDNSGLAVSRGSVITSTFRADVVENLGGSVPDIHPERNETGEPIIQRELEEGEKFNMFQARGGPAEFKVLAKTEHAYFVLQDCFYDGDYDDEKFEFDRYVSDSEVQTSIEKFENEIFPTVMENFAEYDYDYYDINNDGRLMIVFGYVSARKDSPAGIFHPKELPFDYPDLPTGMFAKPEDEPYHGENNMDMVYINIQRLVDLREPPYDIGSESTALSWKYLSQQTVAHEFVHWITNYEGYKKGASIDSIIKAKDLWIDEGLTSLAEYLTGFEKPGNRDRTTERIGADSPLTGAKKDFDFNEYIDKLGFTSYFYEKYGSEGIKEIAGSADYIEAIEDYTGKSFVDVVLDFHTTAVYDNSKLSYKNDEYDVYNFYGIELNSGGSYSHQFDGWKLNQLVLGNRTLAETGTVSVVIRGNGKPGKVRITPGKEVKVRIFKIE